MHFFKYFIFITITFFCQELNGQQNDILNKEKYRPQIHFTPERHWVNDPNGMVFHKGTYHLFFQHSPTASIWSDISWGHATSKDLVHWKREPIAIYPDKLLLSQSYQSKEHKNILCLFLRQT